MEKKFRKGVSELDLATSLDLSTKQLVHFFQKLKVAHQEVLGRMSNVFFVKSLQYVTEAIKFGPGNPCLAEDILRSGCIFANIKVPYQLHSIPNVNDAILSQGLDDLQNFANRKTTMDPNDFPSTTLRALHHRAPVLFYSFDFFFVSLISSPP